MKRNGWQRAALLCGLVGVVGLGSCAGGGSEKVEGAPLSALSDPKAHTGTKTKAVRRVWEAVSAGETDAETGRELLKKTSWSRATFHEVRLAALEELLEDEANLDDTRNMMRLMLPTETSWQVIGLIGTTAGERGWKDLTTNLVRSWSRAVVEPPDSERPERKGLELLHPGRAVEDVVFDVFVGAEGVAPETRGAADNREREQQDAWGLLCRLDTDGSRRKALLSGTAGGAESSALLSVLQRGARELSVLPSTSEELAWLEKLSGREHVEFWGRASSAVSSLSDEQRSGLELRHVPAVVWSFSFDPGLADAGREELLSRVESMLGSRRRYTGENAPTASSRAPEAVVTWRDKMSWGDAVSVLSACRALEEDAVKRGLFAQADEDRRDTSTELGGVVDVVDGLAGLRFFPPRPAQRMGDRRFVASAEMISQSTTSLFHYHLHCTDYENSKYASPSDEDIGYARRHGRGCLVFTCVGKDTLSVDYYQGNGVVLDLGTIARPR